MFREMKKQKNQLNDDEIDTILTRHTSGVLAVNGDDGYPYAIPISYTFEDDQLLFHSANEGHKIEAIKRNDKVSFCVIDQDEIVQETFTTNYTSVIVFGKAKIVTDPQLRQSALESLLRKYSPDFIEKGKQEIIQLWDQTSIIAVTIEHKSGKSNIR